MTQFSDFNLPETLTLSLARMNFDTPTPIQAATIPLGLEGKDVLGTAQTGTGKTAAFSIPLVAHILATREDTALILLPTRELATQVLTVVNELLGYKSPIKTALLIGGESISRQFMQLRNNPRIVVGTPGRVIDHLQRGTVVLSKSSLLVLDETDRMLDMGFGIQLDEIVASLPKERQTLMFSATMPANIIKLSRKYLNNPERIEIGSTSAVATNIQQDLVHTSESGKYAALKLELEKREGTAIIFVKTKMGCDRLADKLDADGYSSAPIHGDLRQRERDRVVRDFRSQRFRILVATDVAARGLDIPHIAHVVNYDLPQCPEDYIHRLGRTARAGAEGQAVSLIAPEDNAKWRAIHRLLNPGEKLQGYEGGEQRRRGGGGGFSRGGGGSRPFNRDRNEGGYESRAPRRDYAPRSEGAGENRAPRRDFGDRPARTEGGYNPAAADRAPRQYSDRPRGEEARAPRTDFKPRYEGAGESRAPRRDFGDRPAAPRRDFAPRHEGAGEARAPRRDFGDRPAAPRGDFKPRRDFGDRPAASARPATARPSAPRTEGFAKRPDRKPADQGAAPKRERKAAW